MRLEHIDRPRCKRNLLDIGLGTDPWPEISGIMHGHLAIR